MRPVRVTLEGFRSHRDRAEFSFAGRSLVGVVGPTGSGKSSILDAITFALYGRTPGTSGVKSLVHNRADAAQVELWLTVDDGLYRVVRSVRTKGQGGQTLERWDDVDGRKLETLADKARDITAWSIERLGLDFDAFTRSVLLAQDRFDLLLKGDPSKGDEVLAGLFGFGVLDAVRDVAKARLDRAEGKLELAEEAKAKHATQVAARDEAQKAADRAAARRAALEAVADDVEAVDSELAATTTGLEVAKERHSAMREAVGGLPPPEEVDRAIDDARQHETFVRAAEQAVSEAEAEHTAATGALEAAVRADVPGTIAALDAAIKAEEAAVQALDRATAARERAEQALAEATGEVQELESARAAAIAESDAAAETVERATARLRGLEAGHAAHLLGEGLAAGDPCPVCLRPIDEPPDLDEVPGLDEARQEASAAAEAATAAADRASAVERDLAAARSRLQGAEAAVADARTAEREAADAAEVAAAARAETMATLEVGAEEPAAALAEAREAYDRLQRRRDETREALDRAKEASEALAASDARDQLRALGRAHAEAAAVCGLELDDDVEPDLLAEALAPVRRAMDEAVVAAQAAVADAERAVGELAAKREAILDTVGLPGDADFAASLADAKRDEAVAVAIRDEKAKVVSEGEAALADAEATAALALRLKRIHADLAPSKFPRFLLHEKRRELAVVGSEWLRLLSSDRYEFAVEDDRFKIRELTAAGLVRDADTLSGGETFLASLSLALGLASMVGMSGGALQAFFIDEGFGSLDAASLDMAMEGIERLVGDDGDRLVVVVSHVPEMRARIDDLIVLGKDSVTGATSVVRA